MQGRTATSHQKVLGSVPPITTLKKGKKTPSVDFPSCTKQLFKCLISCGCFRCLALPFFFTMGYSTFTSDVRAIPLVALVRILPVSQIRTLWPSFVVFFSALKTITLISLHLLTSPIDVYRKWTLLELILLLCSLSPHLVKRDPCWPVSSYLHWLPCILIRISEFYHFFTSDTDTATCSDSRYQSPPHNFLSLLLSCYWHVFPRFFNCLIQTAKKK